MGDEMMSSTSWVTTTASPKNFRTVLKKVADIVAHIGGCQCLPTFLNKYHLSDTFQLSHLADESFHDDDGDNRKQHLVVTNIVQLEDNEAFAKQIKLSVGIQQEVILAALVIRFQHIQEPPHVKILLPCTLGLQDFLILVTDELIEGVEGRNHGTVRAYLLQKEIDRVGERHLLGTCRRLVVTFPQGKDKRLDGLLFSMSNTPSST